MLARSSGARAKPQAVIVFRPLFLILRVTVFCEILHQHVVCVARLHVTSTYVPVAHLDLHDHRTTSLNNNPTTGSTNLSSSPESQDQI